MIWGSLFPRFPKSRRGKTAAAVGSDIHAAKLFAVQFFEDENALLQQKIAVGRAALGQRYGTAVCNEHCALSLDKSGMIMPVNKAIPAIFGKIVDTILVPVL